MPRRNAIVKRKRGRTNKSDDRLQDQHFDDSANLLDATSYNDLSESATPTNIQEATEEEERTNKATIPLHEGLMPLRDLAKLMSTQLACAQRKGLFHSHHVPRRRYPVLSSEVGTHRTVAPKA